MLRKNFFERLSNHWPTWRKIPNLGSEVRDPASGIRRPGSGVRDPASGVRDPASGIWHLESGIRRPGSGIRDPASGIQDPVSGIWSPGSGIRDPGSGVRHTEARAQGRTRKRRHRCPFLCHFPLKGMDPRKSVHGSLFPSGKTTKTLSHSLS